MTLPLNTDHAPVYLIRLPTGDALKANRASIETIEVLLESGSRFAIVLDTRNAELPDGRTRRFLAERMRELHEELNRGMTGFAILYSNLLQKSVAATIGVFIDPPFPIEHFRDEEKAIAWAKGTLSE